MHISSSLPLILCAILSYQFVRCSPKPESKDEKWWYNLTGLAESRQRSQWTTLDSKSSKSPPKLTTPSRVTTPSPKNPNSQFLKRSGYFDDRNESPARTSSRSWEKSYARRRDFDRTWKDDQPIRERFSQTEWDDDVPVRHVFRDSSSSIDEGPSRKPFGDEIQRDRMSRPWSKSDSWLDSPFSNGRNTNTNKNSNNKPKSSSSQPKSDRTDRVLSLNFQDDDSKQRDKDRLNQLARQIFGDMDKGNGNKNSGVTRTNGNSFNGNGRVTTAGNGNGRVTTAGNGRVTTAGNGNGRVTTAGNGIRANGNGQSTSGYVTNAVNSFTRSPGNSYVSANGNGNANKQTSTRLVTTNLVKQPNPKFTAPKSDISPVKVEKTSSPTLTTPAKPKANDIRLVAEKPKSSTTPATQTGFGWRASVNHSNNQKNQKIQNSLEDTTQTSEESSEEDPPVDEDGDFDDDLEDDLDETTTTRPFTTTRTTIRPAFRTTVKATTKSGVEYTTYRIPETTRPQPTPAITNRIPSTATVTTSRPLTTKTATNAIAPDKKQHRMGSWVDSESLDYVEGEDASDEDDSDLEDPVPVGAAPNPPQPLIGEEFEDQQLPERVEEEFPVAPLPAPVPLTEERQFARQSSRGEEGDDQQEGWRLEDALPGVPGTDYPTFATIPRTNFDCRQQEWPGYYADVETQCQVFHICQTGGRKNSFLCPNGTMFNQQIFVCDWWHNVQCGDSTTHYALNENIYDHNWESKRVGTTADTSSVKRSGALTDADIDDGSDSESDDSLEKRMDTDSGPMDAIDEDYADENLQETGKAQFVQRGRSPIKVYRQITGSRIITGPDQLKKRRRKRGHLKN